METEKSAKNKNLSWISGAISILHMFQAISNIFENLTFLTPGDLY